jgi:phosphoribosylformylglycinamidine (FGAM) synthase-like amidotransferase family enzyme
MEMPQEDFSLRWELEDLEMLAQKGGFATGDVLALLRIMNVHEVMEYLDAKMSNRLQ